MEPFKKHGGPLALLAATGTVRFPNRSREPLAGRWRPLRQASASHVETSVARAVGRRGETYKQGLKLSELTAIKVLWVVTTLCC